MTNTAAIQALRDEVKRNARNARNDDFEAIAGNGFSVRYFGDWQNPPDAEDEEDYDWQEPTPSTARKCDEICAAISKRFGVKAIWRNEGEKNWIRFEIA